MAGTRIAETAGRFIGASGLVEAQKQFAYELTDSMVTVILLTRLATIMLLVGVTAVAYGAYTSIETNLGSGIAALIVGSASLTMAAVATVWFRIRLKRRRS